MSSMPIEKHLFGYCPVTCLNTEIPVTITTMHVIGHRGYQTKVDNNCMNMDNSNQTCRACPIVQEYSANTL